MDDAKDAARPHLWPSEEPAPADADAEDADGSWRATPQSFCSHIEKVLGAETVEHVWALHTEKMAEYGFDRLLYGFTRFLKGMSETELDDILILSNLPQEYLDGFFGRGHYRNGPMTRWAAANDGACSWNWARELAASGGLTAEERRAVEYNRAMGVTAGYSISFRELSTRSKGAIGLCARPGLTQGDVDRIWHRHGRAIMMINQITHLRITNLPFVLDRRALTPRQREVLEWVSDGKTTQEIAALMGVSVTTVEKHLRLARDVLGVETTTQAVLKASFHNQIFRLGN